MDKKRIDAQHTCKCIKYTDPSKLELGGSVGCVVAGQCTATGFGKCEKPQLSSFKFDYLHHFWTVR